MSKVFGFKIGEVDLEFPSREDREKALVETYERDTKEVHTRCNKCDAIFTIDTCFDRKYYYKSYTKKYEEVHNFLCDGCFAQYEREYEVHKAKEILQSQEEDDD